MSRAGSIKKDAATGKWGFVVDLSPPGATKRRQARRRGFDTKKAALLELDLVKSAIRTGTYVEPTKLNLGDYLSTWVRSRTAAGLKPTTVHSYRQKIDTYVIGHDVAEIPVQGLTALDLDALYSELLEKGSEKGKGPLSARSVRYLHTIVKMALSDAVRKGLVVRNVAAQATPPSHTSARAPEFSAWSPGELRTFLASVAGHHHAPIFRVLGMAGLRRGEACGLRWTDVDIEGATFTVRHTIMVVDGEARAGGTGKTARSRRTLDLDPATVAVLKAHRRAQREQRMLIGSGYRDDGYVFAQPDGRFWHPDVITRAFDTASRRAHVPQIRLHDLRHTHACHLLMANVNVKVVSERLGHSSVSFTLDTYGHVMPGQQKDAAAAVAALVDGLG